jgi:hypothetical protein
MGLGCMGDIAFSVEHLGKRLDFELNDFVAGVL